MAPVRPIQQKSLTNRTAGGHVVVVLARLTSLRALIRHVDPLVTSFAYFFYIHLFAGLVHVGSYLR